MVMCGRFTVKATLAEIVAMYRLVMEAPAQSSTPLQRLLLLTKAIDLLRGRNPLEACLMECCVEYAHSSLPVCISLNSCCDLVSLV